MKFLKIDHEIQRDVLVSTARSLGWQTVAVASGEAVLEQKRRGQRLAGIRILLVDDSGEPGRARESMKSNLR